MVLIGYRQLRRVTIVIMGISVLLIGIAMIILPGPAFIVIPAGLSILELESSWARRWLVKIRVIISRLIKYISVTVD